MMEAVRTSETSVDNYFTRQYIPEDNSEQVISWLPKTREIEWYQNAHNTTVLFRIFVLSERPKN
jgi:hypothetical protein